MTFREELIEAMAQQYATWRQGEPTPLTQGPYNASLDNARTFMALALDAALAFRQTVECPECGGTGRSDGWTGPVGAPCPAGCVDGRVPGETRLAIVEPVGRVSVLSDDGWHVGDPEEELFLLAPDLPEGTPE